jgi:hypothetical protein
VEAVAGALSVVAQTAAGAVAAGLVARSLHHIGAGGALDERAVGATTADIAHASDMLLCVPRGGVCGTSLGGELALGEAHTGIRASVGADGTLAGNTLVIRKANTLTGLPIANTLVGTLNNGVRIVSSHYITNPCGCPIVKTKTREMNVRSSVMRRDGG